MIILLLLGALLAGLAVVLAARAALGGVGKQHDVLAQVAAYGFGGDQRIPREPNRLQSREIATEIGERLIRRLRSERVRELRQLLNSAGLYQTTVTQYLGYRAVAAIGIPGAILLLLSVGRGITLVGVVVVVFAAAVGWFFPKAYVERRARLRTQKIDYEVPELVDLLVTAIEAGIGFGSALQLCARQIRDPLGAELRLTLGEQSMGLTMNEALENMLERTNQSISMRAFVQAIIQGETMGVSLGKTLRDLAVDMRKRRRQAAEERAQKAPVKLLFPLTFLILPSMFIVILVPAFRAIAHGLAGG